MKRCLPSTSSRTSLRRLWCRQFALQYSSTTPASTAFVQVRQHGAARTARVPVDPSQDATALVDDLLSSTRRIMGQPGSVPYHLIAFSGGVDSSLVAALLHHAKADKEHIKAVLGLSPAVPTEQRQLARRVAEHIGVELEQVYTEEGSDETYLANAGQACLACKTHLYSTLESIIEAMNDTARPHRLYNGTNADDLQDPTRLGLIAADRFGVASPLSSIPKNQVRLAARHLGLPNWNYAASPCLRSRLSVGVAATRDHLQRIERAERHVRERLRPLDETSNLRVRLLAGNRACIEVDQELVAEAEGIDLADFFVDTLGFASVSVRNFRSGSVAGKPIESEVVEDDRERAAVG